MSTRLLIVLVGWTAGWWLLWRVPRVASAGPAPERPRGPVDVSVIIPARDEEVSLPRLLASLQNQTAQPRQIIVVDDHSSDRTAELARSFPGVTVLPGEPLPEGWTGKSWACEQGARIADGTTLVFLDADVVLEPEGLAAVVTAHRRFGGLVSVQPYHRMERAYERFSALFNIVGFMGVGAASPARDGRSRAAFGPCVVTDHDDYRRIGGHGAVRAEIVEDIALGRAYADAGLPVHALGGAGLVSFRMYPGGLGQLVEGWSKNMASGAGSTGPVRLAAVALWITSILASVQFVIEWVLSTGSLDATDVALVWLLVALQLTVMLRQLGNFGWPTALLFPAPAAAFVLVFARSLWLTVVRRQVRWRGRPIALTGTQRSRRRHPPGAA